MNESRLAEINLVDKRLRELRAGLKDLEAMTNDGDAIGKTCLTLTLKIEGGELPSQCTEVVLSKGTWTGVYQNVKSAMQEEYSKLYTEWIRM